MNLKNIIPLFLSLFCTILAGQTKYGIDQYPLMVNLSDPQISPDGLKVVFVVSRPDYENNRNNAELVIVDVNSRIKTVLTQGRTSVSSPRWSPDGKQIAFISKSGSDKSATNQIFVLSMSGGEARQVTKSLKGVQYFSWSPNSTDIAYASFNEAHNKAEVEKGYTGFEIGNNDMFVTAKPVSSHLWLVNTNTNENKRVTDGEWTLPIVIPPGAPSSPFSWSPDGKTLLFVKVESPFSGEKLNRSIQILNVEDGSFKPLTGRKILESYPNYSPDGSKVSYWHKQGDRMESINELWITNINGGLGQPISKKLDRDLYLSAWMPDNNSLLVGGHNDNKTSMWIMNLDGKTTPIDLGNISPSWSMWMDATVSKTGAITFGGSEPSKPVEIYYLSSSSAKPIQLTDYNQRIADMTMGKTETLRWENDKMQQCGIVTYPVNYEAGKKYPLVLIVHGGPNAASVEAFSRLGQVFANEGYFVFEPNYRGSDNQGFEYKMAIMSDMGEGPGRDVMAGLKKLKSSGMIDENRIAVSGWSYGGFMTVWLAGHYSGWKAAVAGAAVTDWVDQYNLSDANAARAGSLGGSPWVGDNMKKYVAQSPITQANKIKAPTLILSNTGDPRVTVTQSYKLYHALKDNGVETKFIGYPVNAHNASDPVTLRERDKAWVEWIKEYLK